MKQLGDVLLERGLATPEQVYEAGQEQRRVGRSMGRVLVDQGVISEADLVRALAAQIGLDYVDLGDALIDPSATALVPGAVCRRHMLVPVRFVEGKLVIAMADPANVIALDDVRSIAKVDLKPVVSTRGDVMAAIARAYRAGDELDSLSTAIEVRNTDEEDLTRIKEVVEEAPIVKFVNLLITQAIQDRAARVGFDWQEIQPVLDKVREEIDEIENAKSDIDVAEEFGDLLFALVNLMRWKKIDAESVLRQTNIKFRKRFSFIETTARQAGKRLNEMTLEEMDVLWEESKQFDD